MTSTPNTIREDIPESPETRMQLTLGPTPELQLGLQSFSRIEDVLQQDGEITPKELRQFHTALRDLTIQVGDDAVSLTTPDLAHNLPLWQALLQGAPTRLHRLTQLTPSTAKALPGLGDRSMYLALTTLDAPTAHALATYRGKHLLLGNLPVLDLHSAQALATWPGESLDLLGLTTLDAPTAQALATWAGHKLFLRGLTTLDAPLAHILAAWPGQVYLEGDARDTYEAAKAQLNNHV